MGVREINEQQTENVDCTTHCTKTTQITVNSRFDAGAFAHRCDGTKEATVENGELRHSHAFVVSRVRTRDGMMLLRHGQQQNGPLDGSLRSTFTQPQLAHHSNKKFNCERDGGERPCPSTGSPPCIEHRPLHFFAFALENKS